MVDRPDTIRSLDDNIGAIDVLFATDGPLFEIKDYYAPRAKQVKLEARSTKGSIFDVPGAGDCIGLSVHPLPD